MNEDQPKQNGLGEPELPPLSGEFIPAGDEPGQQGQQQTAGMAELFAMLFSGISSFVASRKGEHWNATADETKAFGDQADKVAALYMQDSQLSPWIGLALVTLAYAAPRVAIDVMIAKQKAKKETPPDGQQPGPN